MLLLRAFCTACAKRKHPVNTFINFAATEALVRRHQNQHWQVRQRPSPARFFTPASIHGRDYLRQSAYALFLLIAGASADRNTGRNKRFWAFQPLSNDLDRWPYNICPFRQSLIHPAEWLLSVPVAVAAQYSPCCVRIWVQVQFVMGARLSLFSLIYSLALWIKRTACPLQQAALPGAELLGKVRYWIGWSIGHGY